MKLKTKSKVNFYSFKQMPVYNNLIKLSELLPLFLEEVKKDYSNKAQALLVAQNNINQYKK